MSKIELHDAVRYTHPTEGDVIDVYTTRKGLREGLNNCILNEYNDARPITALVSQEDGENPVVIEVGCALCGARGTGMRVTEDGFTCTVCREG